ncbi:MAG: flagellar hook-basal body complex protein FliE, partial [Nitrospirota bacterium]|nr:flagellar hook-basal body complex protein FliE [Nitrospirota bacterium]
MDQIKPIAIPTPSFGELGAAAQGPGGTPASGFMDTLQHAISKANDIQLQASQATDALMTGQSQNVAPETLRSGDYRILRTMPLLFHPADPKQLLFATNVLWKTTSGGERWDIISPDLSRERPDVPESVGVYRTPAIEAMARRGVIYALGPSPLDAGTIWAGTDDG